MHRYHDLPIAIAPANIKHVKLGTDEALAGGTFHRHVQSDPGFRAHRLCSVQIPKKQAAIATSAEAASAIPILNFHRVCCTAELGMSSTGIAGEYIPCVLRKLGLLLACRCFNTANCMMVSLKSSQHLSEFAEAVSSPA